ncbi:glycosyltransferase [Frankia sp. Cppng1_Ct_nod]|uniref:glycosyltransferase n=1 Tax=Frankia sp. Cppng1_Ct_nod TaxID=2897162 RepID=UPI001041117E|nr:glycosyltransferase [Frankia sp. Cppng1_Ct_nod]
MGLTAIGDVHPPACLASNNAGDVIRDRREVVAVVVVAEPAFDPGGWLIDPKDRLAETVGALGRQTRLPDRVVLVDVGGRLPGGARVAAGPAMVVRTVPAGTSFGAAVVAGLAHQRTPASDGFLWLLHDGSVPAPDTLERLLTYAELDRSAAVLGPKVLDRDDPPMVVEVGVSIDAAGRRVTGISPGEVDRGQHDAVRDVLAVATAGALVRATAWHALGGIDPDLTVGFDLDFGWRAWRAGMRVVVVPAATVRCTRPGGDGPPVVAARLPGGRTARRDGLRVRLANIGAGLLVPACLWAVLAGLVRGAGLIGCGRVRGGLDEVVATAQVICRPGWLWRARRRRAASARVRARALRPLFPARGGRLRALSASFTARIVHPEWTVRPEWLTRPAMVLAGLLAVVTVLAARSPLGSWWGPGAPATPLPLPHGARDLWSVVLSGWQAGRGYGSTGSVTSTAGPVPPWLAPLAVLATVFGGKPWLAADVIVLGGPALAGLSAYVAFGRHGPSTPVRITASAGYALAPPMTWAVAVGRVDVVLALMILPGVLAAAVTLFTASGRSSRGRLATCRLAGRLLIAVACAPALLAWAAVGLAATVALLRRPRRIPQVLLTLMVAALPLWSWRSVIIDCPGVLVGVGPCGRFGLVPGWTSGSTSGWPAVSGPVAGQAGHLGAVLTTTVVTAAILVPAALAGAIGIVRADTRRPVLAAWGMVVIGLAGTVIEVYTGSAGSGGDLPGAQLAVAVSGLLLAGALAASGVGAALRRRPFGWRQAVAVTLGGAAAVGPIVSAFAFVSAGEVAVGAGARAGDVVASVAAVADVSRPNARVLVLRQRSAESPVAYTLSDVSGALPAAGDATLEAIVSDLAAGGAWGATGLAALTVQAVVVPLPDASASLVAALDRVPGLVREQMSGDAVVWRPVGSAPGQVPAVPAAVAEQPVAGPSA